MKVVKSRTPEGVTADFAAIPLHETDAMCRTLIGCVSRLFENPAIKADYERWQQERRQRLEGATHAEK